MRFGLFKGRRIISMMLAIITILAACVILVFYKLGYRMNTPTAYTQELETSVLEKNRYDLFQSASRTGAIIPGLSEGAVPQGLCYVEERGVLLYTSYHKGGAPSLLFVVEKETGKLIKTIILYNNHGEPFCGHVGGVASDGKWIWISSEKRIYTISYDVVENSEDMATAILPVGIECPVKCDYVSWDGSKLWIGEYNHPPFYNTDPTHTSVAGSGKEFNALALGYTIDHNDGSLKDIESSLYVPDKVQALIVLEDGSVILSSSFWSFENSKLTCYKPYIPVNCDSYATINGKQIPTFYLEDENICWELEMPPMSEGIAFVDEEIYILFESASRLYSWYTHDRLSHTMIVSNHHSISEGE